MSKSRSYRDEEWLREQYRDCRRSSLDIAEECSVTAPTICKWLNRHGIEIRSSREQVDNYSDKEAWKASMSETKTDGKSKQLQDENWLRERYVEDDLSTYDIAELTDVSRPTVTNWLRHHGIEVANPGPANPGDVARLTDADWLREQYVEKQRPTTSIADQLDVDHRTVRSYLCDHGIEIREQVGENHHQWKGGYDEYYGPNWYDQRRKVLKRDQHRCQRCGITEPQHRQESGRGLDVHHKTPFREFNDYTEANQLENLISLCLSCHMIIEYNDEVTL